MQIAIFLTIKLFLLLKNSGIIAEGKVEVPFL